MKRVSINESIRNNQELAAWVAAMKTWNVKAIIDGQIKEVQVEAESIYDAKSTVLDQYGHIRIIEITEHRVEKPASTDFVVGEKVLAQGAKNKSAVVVTLGEGEMVGRIQIRRKGSSEAQWINVRLVERA